ncbi:MAG: hypothetical protein ACE5JQ_17315 [Candidatus Methylomirabilales bacterium]
MNEPTMDTLAQRLDRVERENRRLKRAGVVALAVIVAVVLMGQATWKLAPPGKPGKVVGAEQFIVHDARGGVRAVLGTLPDGTVKLVLYDRGNPGETRIILSAGPEASPALSFSDKAGKVIWSAP